MDNVVLLCKGCQPPKMGKLTHCKGRLTISTPYHRDDWRLVNRYIDEGKSGTTTHHRRDYQRLFNDLDTDKFDIIVIKTKSINRNTLDWYLFLA